MFINIVESLGLMYGENLRRKIENEDIDVDELSKLVKRAATLIGQCKAKLRDTGSELEEIIDKLDS